MGRKRLFNDKEKWCNKCSKWLPLAAFGENRRTASGKQDYCKTCHNAYTGSFWAKVAAYEQLLAQKWRMSPDDYLELWRLQDKKCVICGTPLTLYHRDTHIHVFGYQKRLLCTACDKGMVCFRDDPGLLVRALDQVKEVKEGGEQEGSEQDKNPDADKSASKDA
jgi:hypothetical protein